MLSILLLQSSLLVSPISNGSIEAPENDQPLLDINVPSLMEGWTGTASVSLTDVSGNAASTNAAVGVALAWEEGLDAITLGAQYAGVRTTDKATGDASTTTRLYQYDSAYKRFFSDMKNLYGYVNAGTRQDEPNGLQMRSSAGVGLGYRHNPYTEAVLDLEGGISYVAENKVGTLTENSAVGRLAFDFHGPWRERFALFANGEYLNGGDIESYVQELGATWDLTEDWKIVVSNNVAWDGNPSAGFSSTDRRWNLLLSTSF